jgi:nucleotide-binding universal stress UspA family protein
MFKTIIAATDGSKHGARAIKLAADLARLSKGELFLVHVRPLHGTTAMLEQAIEAKGRLSNASFPIHGMLSQRALDAIASLTLEDAEMIARNSHVSGVTRLLLKGDAADSILKAAKKQKADVIVVGRRGMGRLAGLLVGSVSQKINQLADCPVFTVK